MEKKNLFEVFWGLIPQLIEVNGKIFSDLNGLWNRILFNCVFIMFLR